MKKISCVIGAWLLIAGAFAKGGVLAGAGKLSVMQTTYFDIIFPAESAEAAKRIAAVSDDYYAEISALLRVPCNEHFVVTITHAVESLNAYFAVAPYNRIVLYDTPPDNTLDMHTDTLESVFYHELTHAVTSNTRSPLAGFLAGLFGDWFAPAGFMQTSFMLEGAAVSFESLNGAGRVHDPYNTHLVQQAKADGRFPSWRDVTGARDIFPGGTDAYAFGALFSHFLQETYGMESYARFWQTTGKIHGFKRSIKKTYGKPIAELWNDFKAWVSVPALTADGTSIFAEPPDSRAVLTHIDTNETAAVWFDTQSGGVWYAPFGNDGIEKPKKLLTCAAVTRLALSPDNTYLAISYLFEKQTIKAGVSVYHLPSGKLISLPFDSVRDAGFMRGKNGEVLLTAVSISDSYRPALNVYTVGKTKTDFALVGQLHFSENEMPFSPVAAENGGCACIIKNGLQWTIRLYHADGSYRDYGGAKTILHNLHTFPLADSTGTMAFSFSYAALGSEAFPRAGMLFVAPHTYTSELFLQNDDVLGAVFDAALLPYDGNYLLYEAAFYDTHRLMQLDTSQRTMIRHRGSAPKAKKGQGIAPPPGAESSEATTALTGTVREGETLSYNPFRYYRHGMLIPVGMVNAYDRDGLEDYVFGYTNLGSAFIGATYGSSNPWGDKIAVVSGGWNPFDKNGGMYLDYSGGTDTFSYDVNGTVVFDEAGFMQTTEGISLTKTLYARFGKSIAVGATGAYFYGHDTRGAENDWSLRARTFAQFSTVHKMSARYLDYGGVYAQPFLFGERVQTRYVNAGLTLGARIPGLFPLSVSATLFPSSGYAAAAAASVVLFSWELQKGIPLALYVKRIYLTAAYVGRVSYRTAGDRTFDLRHTAHIFRDVTKDDYSDVAQVRLGAVSAVNAGILSRIGFDTGIVLQYRPHPTPSEKKMRVGVSASLVY